MTVLVTGDEMAEAERRTMDSGISGPELMRRAAIAIADWVEAHCVSAGSVVGLVGPGNNGGDTLVALGILGARGWRSRAVFVSRDEFGDLPLGTDEQATIEVVDFTSANDADVILDGIYGFRSRPTLPAHVASLCNAVSRARAASGSRVIAMTPSGIDVTTGEAATQRSSRCHAVFMLPRSV